jgi:hypothetical protein
MNNSHNDPLHPLKELNAKLDREIKKQKKIAAVLIVLCILAWAMAIHTWMH